ncbi:MAG: hypothetical protein WBM58_19350 [Sedimenticolaceae bacterium]
MTPRLAGTNEINVDIRIGIEISKNNSSLASASARRLAHQSFAMMSKPIALPFASAKMLAKIPATKKKTVIRPTAILLAQPISNAC